jgi:Protein of unknown function (DUF4058)
MIHSPFPGMDPYLETPSIWPDVHTDLMCILAEQLTVLLAPRYLAELETQMAIDRLDDDPHPPTDARPTGALGSGAGPPHRLRVGPL